MFIWDSTSSNLRPEFYAISQESGQHANKIHYPGIELRKHYLVSVYKLLFFICVMSRKRSGHPELIEKNGFPD
ncbi:hypothetical protein BMS3Abin07_02411 [bacterium BMS3Abin07]|nr:hypothetical protein BMS3Abin07_02411 [bacterium BMS3Abin07]GBE31436.1 hypothetical protein BMS3Bbin05_00336 [bacterium BMS3Bbin05]